MVECRLKNRVEISDLSGLSAPSWSITLLFKGLYYSLIAILILKLILQLKTVLDQFT